MDLELVHAFVDIVEARSLAGAAKRRGVTRSHISRLLARLEVQAGALLIRRTTRRLELTEQGVSLYEHGVRILRELESAKAAIDGLGHALRGHIRVSVPSGLGDLLAGGLLLEFAQHHPDVSLHVHFSNRIDDLIASQIDVALKITSAPPLDYVARDLGPVRWQLYASPTYLKVRIPLVRPEDLEHCDFVCVPGPARRVPLRLWKEDASVTLHVTPRVQSEHFSFLVRAAIQGVGVAVLASYMAGTLVQQGSLAKVLPEWTAEGFGDKLYAVSSANPHTPLVTRALIDFLREKLRDLDSLGK